MRLITFLVSFFTTFFIGVIKYDISHIRQVNYRFYTNRLKKNCRIALISDLHGRDYGENNKMILESLKSNKPDLVIMAGDILSAKLELKVDSAYKLIEDVSNEYTLYYGIGNHEGRLLWKHDMGLSYDEYLENVSNNGAIVLDNTSAFNEEFGIEISGLSLDKEYFDKATFCNLDIQTINSLRKRNDAFSIMIAHNPDYFDAYSKSDIDLVLSGHIHGGIMRLPFNRGAISPNLQLFSKYAGGKFRKNRTIMVVSRGLGYHTIPVRVFNPLEIDYIDLIRTKE